MDSLFPIKIDIPENRSSYLHFFNRNKICFLLSSNDKIIEIHVENNNYFLGEIKKDEKVFYIYYVEIFDISQNSNIKIDIADKSFFLHPNKNTLEVEFIFNNFLYDKEDKKICKLNFFDIYEEFEIFYRIHSEKKNVSSLKWLISSCANIIKKEGKESNLSFFFIIFIKDQSIFNPNDDILKNIKNKGDLTRISKDEFYKITVGREKYIHLYLIYLFFFPYCEELKKLLVEIKNSKQIMLECIKKYKFLFSNTIELYPEYSFLMSLSESLDELKIILKCSKNLSDLIYIINENKIAISRLLKKDNKSIIIEEIFNLEMAFNESVDDNFYFLLNEIKEYEKKTNLKLFYFFSINNHETDKITLKLMKYYHYEICIKILIFLYIREELTMENRIAMIGSSLFIHRIQELISAKNLNNVEIIEIIDIISNLPNDWIKKEPKASIFLMETIKFIKLENEKEKSFFSKVKWDIFFDDMKIYLEVINTLVSKLKNIDNFDFVFIIIDKLIEKENNIPKDKGEIKENDNYKKYHDEIIFSITLLIEKYLLLLKESKNEKNYRANKFIQITSKLIYLQFVYSISKNFLLSIIETIESELLNDIFISILKEYDIFYSNFESLIDILIQKKNLEKFIIY